LGAQYTSDKKACWIAVTIKVKRNVWDSWWDCSTNLPNIHSDTSHPEPIRQSVIFSSLSHFNRNLTAMSASSGQDKHDIENKASIMGQGGNPPPFPPQFQRDAFYFDPF
jgi:hypothetical protein